MCACVRVCVCVCECVRAYVCVCVCVFVCVCEVCTFVCLATCIFAFLCACQTFTSLIQLHLCTTASIINSRTHNTENSKPHEKPLSVQHSTPHLTLCKVHHGQGCFLSSTAQHSTQYHIYYFIKVHHGQGHFLPVNCTTLHTTPVLYKGAWWAKALLPLTHSKPHVTLTAYTSHSPHLKRATRHTHRFLQSHTSHSPLTHHTYRFLKSHTSHPPLLEEPHVTLTAS